MVLLVPHINCAVYHRTRRYTGCGLGAKCWRGMRGWRCLRTQTGIEYSLNKLVHGCTLLAVLGLVLEGHLNHGWAETAGLLVGSDAVIREDSHLAWNCLDRTSKESCRAWNGGIRAMLRLSTAIIQAGWRFNFSFCILALVQ